MPQSRWIRIEADTGSFDAYLSLPPAAKLDGAPGIVLLQEIFGVNEHIRAVADQYAADGYVVLAPDVFWRLAPRVELGYAGADMERALSLRKQVDVGLALQGHRRDRARAAPAQRRRQGRRAGLLLRRPAVLPVRGARLWSMRPCPSTAAASRTTCRRPRPSRSRCSSTTARSMPTSRRSGTAGARGGGGQARRVFVYEQADHGFNCWARASYHQHSAALSHGRALTFLADAL